VHLERLNDRSEFHFVPPGIGSVFEDASVRALTSLYDLKDMAWAGYVQGTEWRLHVAAGLEVRLNGLVTGGSALRTGDIIESAGVYFRFIDRDWPGESSARLEAQSKGPWSDANALVYRDWLLERDSPRAETLRRPVSRAEQARHVWPLSAEVASGLVDVVFEGSGVVEVAIRAPALDGALVLSRLALCVDALPALRTLRVFGLTAAAGWDIAHRLARERLFDSIQALRPGTRGGWWDIAAMRAKRRSRHDQPLVSLEPDDAHRPVMLEVVSWDGWTSVEPLTSTRVMRLDEPVSLAFHDGGGALGEGTCGDILLKPQGEWLLEVSPRVPDAFVPRRDGLRVRGTIGLSYEDAFELVPGLVCRISPA
jgi:hypothetical protein